MSDQRLDDLSIEDLERLLEQKRREAAQFKAARVEALVNPIAARFQWVGRLGKKLPRPSLSRWRDRFLLLVEVGALAGLVAVLVVSLREIQSLNQEVAQARSAAKTPTPPTEILLPASSFPPANTAGIPDRYKNLIQPLVPIAIPTPGPQQAVRIVIPAIGVDAPVVEGDGWEELKKGVGHHIGSANPGERGNVVLSGHNDVFGEIFRYLERLKVDDEVTLYTQERPFRYVVKGRRIVEPTEVSVMAPTTEPTLTLITCYPYLIDTQRIVVFAQLAER